MQADLFTVQADLLMLQGCSLLDPVQIPGSTCCHRSDLGEVLDFLQLGMVLDLLQIQDQFGQASSCSFLLLDLAFSLMFWLTAGWHHNPRGQVHWSHNPQGQVRWYHNTQGQVHGFPSPPFDQGNQGGILGLHNP